MNADSATPMAISGTIIRRRRSSGSISHTATGTHVGSSAHA